MTNQRDPHRDLRQALANWKDHVRPYQRSSRRKALWQIVNTSVPLAALWAATYLSLRWSIWLAVVLALPTAFLVSRMFILQHDCGHYSFVKSRRGNEILGFCFSLVTSIPFHYWAKVHRHHHKHNGQFEGRGIGDVPFLRVEEYQKLSRPLQIAYRICRNPLVLFGIAPAVYLFVSQRLPLTPLSNPRQTIRKQLVNNLALVALYLALGSLLGWSEFFIVQGLVLCYFATIAFWIFHVQHLHEHTLKQDASTWSHVSSAIRGSSHYDMPAWLHWMTGNIGIHHIHHLSPSIPNYELQRCYRNEPILTRYASSISVVESWAQIHADLWDEESQRMISFAELASRQEPAEELVFDAQQTLA